MSRLILLSGANPNMKTNFLNGAPVISIASREGFTDMVSLLLELNALVDLPGDDGMTPLCYAAEQGQIEVIRLLMARRAKVGGQSVILQKDKQVCIYVNTLPLFVS